MPVSKSVSSYPVMVSNKYSDDDDNDNDNDNGEDNAKIKLSLNDNGEDNAKITVMMMIITTDIKLVISNGSRTGWSTIQGALMMVN